MAIIIVALNLLDMGCRCDAWYLVEFAKKVRQSWVVFDPLTVTLKVSDIDRIKTNQGREESPVRLGDLIAHQVAVGGQDGLDPIERSEKFSESFLISILAGCEATSVHAVVDRVVNALIDRIDFRRSSSGYKSSVEPVIRRRQSSASG